MLWTKDEYTALQIFNTVGQSGQFIYSDGATWADVESGWSGSYGSTSTKDLRAYSRKFSKYDAQRFRCKFNVTAPTTDLASAADFFVFTVKTDAGYAGQNVWDANGSPITENTYWKFETGSPATTSSRLSGYPFSTTTIPSECGSTRGDARGWEQDGAAVVWRWNVTGGFQYT
jgi:hypothetical protein